MKNKSRLSVYLMASLVFLLSLANVGPLAWAQQNLIFNSDMEGGFAAGSGVSGVPLNWGFVKLSGNLDADRQAFAPYAHSGTAFWTMRGSYSTFVAAGFQTVTVTPGTFYRLAAFTFIWSCNDNVYSCIKDDGKRVSQTESGMKVRVGLDPNGGIDPNAGSIIWGPWVQPFDVYQGITVDAEAKTGLMTAFIMADGGQAMVFNEAYWDDITLVAITTPANTTTTTTTAANTTTTTTTNPGNFVPFVNRQQARPDGSLVHRVGEGDTFDSIALAYFPLGINRQAILDTNGWTFPPQFIFVGQEILILPPGSIDPNTGQLLSLTGGAVVPAAVSDPAVAQAPITDAAPVVELAAPSNPAPAFRTLTGAEVNALSLLDAITPFVP